jgi:polysaccharide export outer membrane protein
MIFSLFLLLAAPQSAKPQAAIPNDQRLYVVGANDVLTVSVYDQPQLTGKYAVEGDGTFTFPLIGRVRVGGLSLRGIEDEIRNLLSRGYLKNPQVSVGIDQYRSQQVFVMGEVQRPGELQFTGAMTLVEALARVGSTTERAGAEVQVVRPRNGADAAQPAIPAAGQSSDSEVIRVDLQNLLSGATAQNMSLRAGDTVFIPRAETVFVSGQVQSSGEYPIRRGMTVRQVLALAGGVTERGSTRRIQIIRKVNGKETTTGASLQDQVQGGDTVLVRDRLF